MATYIERADSIIGPHYGQAKTRERARELALRKFLRAAAKHLGKPVARGELWPACFYGFLCSDGQEPRLLGSVPGDPYWRKH